jgi:hypothetical protein
MTFVNTAIRSSPQRFHCGAARTIIALNNIAVSLLVRHSYGQALEVFNDAVVILRDFLPQAQEDAPAAQAQCWNLLGSSLQKATRILARCEQTTGADSLHDFCIFNEENTRQILEALQQGDEQTNSLKTTALIRIELEGRSFGDVVDDFDSNFEAAIILYNYASCYRLLASTASDVNLAQYAVTGAFNLYDIARTFLQEDRTDEMDALQYLPILLLVIRSQTEIATYMEMEPSERQDLMTSYWDAKETAEDLHDIFKEVRADSAAAA